MAVLKSSISMSLDGYVAGPGSGVEEPLGRGGERLHEWMIGLASWREPHGLSGGTRGPSDVVVAESVENVGAVVMGRRMFLGPPDEGPWGDEPGIGVWGEEPPFRVPVFVLTHHPREPLAMANGTSFTFVTDGIEAAVDQARAAAGGRDVSVAGGASVVQQCLKAGLLDELNVNIAPVLLGHGVRLFDLDGADAIALEQTRVLEAPGVAHVRYRVAR